MRLAVIVVVGILVGVLAARFSGRSTALPAHPPPVSQVTPAEEPRTVRWATAPREPTTPQRELSPSDQRYNPILLQRENEGTTIKEIFESEPRDPRFAPVLEQRARAALDRVFQELRLHGKIRGVQTECKTLSCSTFVEVDEADVEEVYDQINGILIGDSQAPGLVRATNGKPASVTLYNLYRPDTRNEDYYRRFLEEAMQPALDLAKQRYLKDNHAADR